jgi:hypothetical protein
VALLATEAELGVLLLAFGAGRAPAVAAGRALLAVAGRLELVVDGDVEEVVCFGRAEGGGTTVLSFCGRRAMLVSECVGEAIM